MCHRSPENCTWHLQLWWYLRGFRMHIITGVCWCIQEKWGLTSPGPNCPQKSTFGYQNMSGNRTAPVINFTKGQRTLVRILEAWEQYPFYDTNVCIDILFSAWFSEGPGRWICWTGRVSNQRMSRKAAWVSEGYVTCLQLPSKYSARKG